VKKLKLVISDLYLGTGKFLPTGEINSFEEFYFDEKFSQFLNFYSSGAYEESEVELILNGDIFNFLQVDYRGHYLSVITEPISVEKLRRIIDGHPLFFDALRRFINKPYKAITYIVGNHDQCMLWSGTKQVLNEALGRNLQYKNIIYEFDGVHVEHGHMHEPANRLDPKKFFIKKDIPEPILNLPFGSHFFVDFVLPVKRLNPYIDKVRPLKSYVRWGLLYDTRFTIFTALKLFWFFLMHLTGIMKDKLNNKLNHSQTWSWSLVWNIFKSRTIFPDLIEPAKQLLEDDKLHTVIFGHSHVYHYKQFAADKEYFNTGTWTELTSLDLKSLGKITKLTYVLLDYSDDLSRPRGRLKQWKGYHRIDEDVDVA
jgi:UDP-2,3-diacylglucosamine pyrophosphatase LpxH